MRLLLAGFHLPSGRSLPRPLPSKRRDGGPKERRWTNSNHRVRSPEVAAKEFLKAKQKNSRNIEEGGLWLAGQLMGLHVLLGSDNLDLQRGST
jgi:hypothetical protein